MKEPKTPQTIDEQNALSSAIDQSSEIDNNGEEAVVIPFVIDKDTVSRFNPSRFGL